MDSEVEVRCPVPQTRPDGSCSPGKLLFKMRQAGEQESYVHPDNLILLSCDDCKHKLRREGRQVFRVVHAYNFLGELVRSFVEDFPLDT